MNPTLAAAPDRRTEHFNGSVEDVPAVRAFVATHLRNHPALDDIVLAASEYASNAVLHSKAAQAGGFKVILAAIPDGRVRLEVRDPGPAPEGANALAHRPDGEHGRGLGIISQLAVTSGHAHTRSGHLAWAEFAWPAQNSSPSRSTT